MRLQSWNLLTVFLFLSTLTASPALLLAQSDNNEKSSLVVDLDIDQLRASELMNAIDFKNGIVAQFLPFDMEKVKRIYGTAQSPKAIQKLTEMETGKPIPFNFLVQVQYKDEQSAKAMLDSMSDQGSKEVERGGKKFITPEDGEAPPNLLAHVGQNNRFEVGTEGYILKDTRDFLSSSLAEIWRKNSKSNAVRLSIDIESNRKFINEALKVARKEAPASMQGFLTMFDDMATLSLSLDLDSGNLLTLVATGKDENGTRNLNASLDGLLGLGRMFGGQMAANPDMDEQSKATLKEILDSLKTSTSGNTVTIKVPRPKGFEEMIKKMQ